MSDFLSQGGYGFYVWSAYAVSVLGVGYLIASTLAAWRKAKRALAVLQIRKPIFETLGFHADQRRQSSDRLATGSESRAPCRRRICRRFGE